MSTMSPYVTHAWLLLALLCASACVTAVRVVHRVDTGSDPAESSSKNQWNSIRDDEGSTTPAIGVTRSGSTEPSDHSSDDSQFTQPAEDRSSLSSLAESSGRSVAALSSSKEPIRITGQSASSDEPHDSTPAATIPASSTTQTTASTVPAEETISDNEEGEMHMCDEPDVAGSLLCVETLSAPRSPVNLHVTQRHRDHASLHWGDADEPLPLPLRLTVMTAANEKASPAAAHAIVSSSARRPHGYVLVVQEVADSRDDHDHVPVVKDDDNNINGKSSGNASAASVVAEAPAPNVARQHASTTSWKTLGRNVRSVVIQRPVYSSSCHVFLSSFVWRDGIRVLSSPATLTIHFSGNFASEMWPVGATMGGLAALSAALTIVYLRLQVATPAVGGRMNAYRTV